MNTLLFAVGSFVFMFTVYGTLVAGGVVLNRKQRQERELEQMLRVDDTGLVQPQSVAHAHADLSPESHLRP